MSILQIRRLSVNSITLNYWFWEKAGDTFLNLFIGSNRVIVCSESSVVRSDVYRFVQDSPILFSGPPSLCSSIRLLRSLLLFLSFSEVTSQQQCVLVHRQDIPVQLNSSLNGPGSLLSCCLCFTQHVREKKFASASAVKLLTQSFDGNLCHSASISSLIHYSISFSARARYSEGLSFSNFPNMVTSQNLLTKL